MKVGRKLATKLLNLSKFVLGASANDAAGTSDATGANADAQPQDLADQAMLLKLADVVGEATTALEQFDYARALERTEAFFWWFCDDYVELVKVRAYGENQDSSSARVSLHRALGIIQRLLAPMLPFVTEEVWSWWQSGTIHKVEWPTTTETLAGFNAEPNAVFGLDSICVVLAAVRRAKTEAKVSQRAEVAKLIVTADAKTVSMLQSNLLDLRNAGALQEVEFVVSDSKDESVEISAQVTLASPLN